MAARTPTSSMLTSARWPPASAVLPASGRGRCPPRHRAVSRESRLGGLPRSFVSVAGQDAMELVAGADVELGEDLVQVVFDGARAHEQLGSDLGVGQALAGQPGDLGFPRGELVGGAGGACADSLAGGTELARGSFREPVGSHHGKYLVGGAQLPAGVDAPVLRAQPLSVKQMGAPEFHAQAGAAEPVERLAVAGL